MMRTQTWITLPLTTLLFFLLLLGVSSQTAQAQASNEAPLQITAVDIAQFPTVQLTLAGSTWPTDRVAAPLQILVNGEPQTLVDDQTVQQPLGFMVAVDANELLVNGQERYVAMTGALLDLIENEILLRNQDWLAAYLLLPSEVQSIQDWTQEPNLVFNSIVQKQPPELSAAPLTAPTLINTLQHFAEGPAAATPHKALLLISAGAPTLEVAPVVAAAQALAAQIHVVELVSGTDSASSTPLAQVAQQTGGHYLALDNPGSLQPLWQRLAAAHNARNVTFQSTVAAPQTLEVQLQLSTGALVVAAVGSEAFAALPAPPTPTEPTVATEPPPAAPQEAAPAAQNVVTQAGTQSTVAYTPPVTSEQVAVAQPAAAEAVPAAVELPAGGSNSGAVASDPGVVTVPGLQVGLPRGLLQFSLVVLLGLIGYFGYAELRDRRRKRNRRAQPNVDPLFSLEENSEPLPANQFRLQGQDPRASRSAGEAPAPAPLAPPPPPRSAPPPARPAARPPTFFQEDEEEEAELTVRPGRREDEEATYRMQALEQPILGYLMRTTSDPTLPKELPVHDLSPAPGEVRQIHIGRHSKHNTVVINDKSISREHAVIIQRQGRLYLRDNASSAGTFLNGKRLNAGEELLLRHNDLIGFGQIVYEFRLHGEDEVTIAES